MRTVLALSAILVLASCVDHPVGPGAPLPVVTGFSVDEERSDLNEVVLYWDSLESIPVEGFEGYRLSFRQNDEGEYVVLAEVSPETDEYTHLAPSAGGYAIEAFNGDLVSETPSTTGTMPFMVTHLYTVWNDLSPDTAHTAIEFGETTGMTGRPGSSGFTHDLYCYDGGQGCPTWLYSGNFGPYPTGNQTLLFEASTTFAMPEGSSELSMPVFAGDVLFGKLQNRHYVKIYSMEIPEYPGGQAEAYGIKFYYDYQPIQDLYLFTADGLP